MHVLLSETKNFFPVFACSYIKVKPLVSQANRGEEKLLF